ncbi:MAG: gluconate 2-dehydrogenase subunit 3 family protein [Gammaproteobacteria bacterium]
MADFTVLDSALSSPTNSKAVMIRFYQSRRAFLQSAGAAMKGSLIVLTIPAIVSACDRATRARLEQRGLSNLGTADAVELAAVAARIIPTDETPGASEAGVIYFFDQVLDENRAEQRALLSVGVRDLNRRAAANSGVNLFSELTAGQQDSLLATVEDSPFFATMRFLTVAGMFALPEYGGTGPELGYQLIGFEDRHAWAPPYGFYDADYMEKGE